MMQCDIVHQNCYSLQDEEQREFSSSRPITVPTTKSEMKPARTPTFIRTPSVEKELRTAPPKPKSLVPPPQKLGQTKKQGSFDKSPNNMKRQNSDKDTPKNGKQSPSESEVGDSATFLQRQVNNQKKYNIYKILSFTKC